MKTKHTPGPWAWESRRDSSLKNLIGDGKIIARAVDLTDLINFGESREANARLIAAAPELLEALEVALETLLEQPELVGDADISIRTIKAAIAKATGCAE